MQPSERVFAFEDPVEFLKFELRERQKSDPRFSLRAWSRQVGYKNPSYLAHVLARKRKLKLELAEKLAQDLELEGKPLKYFELIVLGHAGGSEKEKQTYVKLSKAVRPRRARTMAKISPETFAVVAEWYHIAILEMTQLEGFDSSLEFIYSRLGGKVSKPVLRLAVDRLVRVGLLKKLGQALIRCSSSALMIETPAPSEAIRAYHREMAALGQQAITSQTKAERDFFGTTLAYRRENMEKARDILREAHRKLLELAEQGTGEDLYHLNTQFFRLSARKTAPKNRLH